jgi:GNAT superfamily N-acetyltransferase
VNYDDIEIREVESPSQMMTFIKLPWKIYKDNPCWVPPLISAQKELLDKKKNPFFRYSDVHFFIAWHNGEPVGRIASIINRNHNNYHQENVGFFGFFESIPDYEVARKMLKVVMIHLKKDQMDYMRGPVNLSTNYEVAALVDSFDQPPVVNMIYNPPYYPEYYEKFGFEKKKDLLAYKITDEDKPPERMVRVAEKIRERDNLKIRNINLKNFKSELKIVSKIYNNAWAENWGFVPVPEDEFVHIAKDMKPLVDPDLVFIAEADGEPIGFSLSLPNVYQVLPYANGRLFPFGALKLLWHTKVRNKIDSIRIITLGIEKEYQKRGIDTIFYLETFRRATRKGYKWGELSWILEDNTMMNRAAEMLGAKRYKTYRIYETPLHSQ